MKKNVFIGFLFSLTIHYLAAHNPITSKFELRASLEEGALLNIYLTQAGVHKALTKKYPEMPFEKMPLDEYKELIVSYVKEHTHLIADGVPLQIGEGRIKLTNHQTDLQFHLKNYSNSVEKLEVKVDAFQENKNQQTVFWWLTPNKSGKLSLAAHNNFKGTLEKKTMGTKNKSTRKEFVSNHFKWYIVCFSLIAVVLLILIIRKFNSIKVT